MATTLKLDASALRVLIADDEEFKLELQRAVISEVVRRLFADDMSTDVDRLIAVAFSKHKDALIEAVHTSKDFEAKLGQRLDDHVKSVYDKTYGRTSRRLSPELQKLLDDHANSIVADAIREREKRIEALIKQTQETLEGSLEERLEKRLSGYVSHNIEVWMRKAVADRMTEKAKEAIGALFDPPPHS